MITLGIDIGGSATKGALVDTVSGRMVSDRIRFETEAPVKPRKWPRWWKKSEKSWAITARLARGIRG